MKVERINSPVVKGDIIVIHLPAGIDDDVPAVLVLALEAAKELHQKLTEVLAASWPWEDA